MEGNWGHWQQKFCTGEGFWTSYDWNFINEQLCICVWKIKNPTVLWTTLQLLSLNTVTNLRESERERKRRKRKSCPLNSCLLSSKMRRFRWPEKGDATLIQTESIHLPKMFIEINDGVTWNKCVLGTERCREPALQIVARSGERIHNQLRSKEVVLYVKCKLIFWHQQKLGLGDTSSLSWKIFFLLVYNFAFNQKLKFTPRKKFSTLRITPHLIGWGKNRALDSKLLLVVY